MFIYGHGLLCVSQECCEIQTGLENVTAALQLSEMKVQMDQCEHFVEISVHEKTKKGLFPEQEDFDYGGCQS